MDAALYYAAALFAIATIVLLNTPMARHPARGRVNGARSATPIQEHTHHTESLRSRKPRYAVAASVGGEKRGELVRPPAVARENQRKQNLYVAFDGVLGVALPIPPGGESPFVRALERHTAVAPEVHLIEQSRDISHVFATRRAQKITSPCLPANSAATLPTAGIPVASTTVSHIPPLVRSATAALVSSLEGSST